MASSRIPVTSFALAATTIRRVASFYRPDILATHLLMFAICSAGGHRGRRTGVSASPQRTVAPPRDAPKPRRHRLFTL